MNDAQQSTSSGVRRSTRTRMSRVTVTMKKTVELDDVESSELSEMSEEESSDFDEPTHRAKRAKLEVSPKKRVVSLPTRRKKTLSLLPTMPFDVLMEVLARLRVADIIALSRTSKEFRALLLSRKSISVWKAALSAEGCLECPADLSEPAYAVLLFGGTNCYNCGTKGIQRIDFGLRRRLCVRCLKVKLFSEKRFDRLFPDSDSTVLELIPYTHTGGHSHGHSSNGRFFYRDDLVKTKNSLKALEGVKDSETAIKEYIKSQRDKTWSIISTVRKYEAWAESANARKAIESESRVEQRWEDIRQRFRNLGYVDEDIEAVQSHSSVKSNTPLTNQGWGRVRPRLEALILETKTTRITKSRVVLLSDAYADYMRTLQPIQWAALPRIWELRALPEVQTLLQRDIDSEISKDELLNLLNDNTTIQKWIEGRQRILEVAIESELSSTGNNALVSSASCKLLSTSAQHVFICTTPDCKQRGNPTGSRTLISLSDALNHHCTSDIWTNANTKPIVSEFAYSVRGSGAVKHILSLLKLPPTTTPTELDKLKNLFICCKCTPRLRIKDGKRHSTFGVFTWREAVLHYFKDCLADHRSETIDPQFTRVSLLDPNMQGGDLHANTGRIWSCLHCSVHLNNWVNRNEVIAHVKASHPIVNPAELVDFFADPLAGSRPASQWQLCLPEGAEPPPALRALVVAITQPAASTATVDSTQQFRCKLCSSSSTRRFILTGVQSHIKDVHKVPPQSQRTGHHFDPV